MRGVNVYYKKKNHCYAQGVGIASEVKAALDLKLFLLFGKEAYDEYGALQKQITYGRMQERNGTNN